MADQLGVFEKRNQEKLERERKEGLRKELRKELESGSKKYRQVGIPFLKILPNY